ncbi:hypothetical protein CHARACLAT_022658 [Characodon lateralis]|uniref:Uncharacterized protein n=1 Tax=Characodon lateralis TaxID=208331 RepID=A0ABU7EW67_9TELE|nr:hypothetical protein [Characodon lateralis]
MPSKPVKGENSIQAHLRPASVPSTYAGPSSPVMGMVAQSAPIKDVSALKSELVRTLLSHFKRKFMLFLVKVCPPLNPSCYPSKRSYPLAFLQCSRVSLG